MKSGYLDRRPVESVRALRKQVHLHFFLRCYLYVTMPVAIEIGESPKQMFREHDHKLGRVYLIGRAFPELQNPGVFLQQFINMLKS